MELPQTLVDYLSEEKRHQKPYSILKLNDGFKLLEMECNEIGDEQFCRIDSSLVGLTLESIYPFLEETIPEKGQLTCLPNIEVSSNEFADVIIFPEKKELIWVLLIDNTKEVTELQKIIQKTNESALAEEKMTVTSNSDTGIGLLNSLGYAVFMRVLATEDRFKQVGTLPDWMQKLTSGRAVEMKQADIIDLFPYLEVFLVEAQQLWQSDNFVKTASNIFTEMDRWGTEYYLQAFAVNLEQEDYLLIAPTDISIKEKQHIIQKAREKSLDFERLEKAEATLKKILLFKDRFVSMLSHDLRAPLGMMANYAENLVSNKDFEASLNEKQLGSMKIISGELRRISDYNERLYHWSILELGRFKMKQKKHPLAELVANTLELFTEKFEQKELQVIQQISADIEIEVDESLFGQVLNNLIGNAIKFTPKGGRISVSGDREGQKTCLKIADSGVGIDEKIQQSIFKDAVADHTFGTDGEDGSGIGLNICKHIIDAHGFEISFASEINKGTQFTISIG